MWSIASWHRRLYDDTVQFSNPASGYQEVDLSVSIDRNRLAHDSKALTEARINLHKALHHRTISAVQTLGGYALMTLQAGSWTHRNTAHGVHKTLDSDHLRVLGYRAR